MINVHKRITTYDFLFVATDILLELVFWLKEPTTKTTNNCTKTQKDKIPSFFSCNLFRLEQKKGNIYT